MYFIIIYIYIYIILLLCVHRLWPRETNPHSLLNAPLCPAHTHIVADRNLATGKLLDYKEVHNYYFFLIIFFLTGWVGGSWFDAQKLDVSSKSPRTSWPADKRRCNSLSILAWYGIWVSEYEWLGMGYEFLSMGMSDWEWVIGLLSMYMYSYRWVG